MKCSYCDRDAVVAVRYAKLRLCPIHLAEWLESRVMKAIERYGLIEAGDTVAVGVSGGKDSLSLADILLKIGSKVGFKTLLIHIDMGIGDYSEESKRVFSKFCSERGADCLTFNVAELGASPIALSQKLKSKRVCGICGAVKRYALNAAAIEAGASSLATAHHADDMVVYLLKAFLLQDYDQLSKIGPIGKSLDGMAVRKIKPLYEIYESELAAYASSAGIEYVRRPCPYKHVGHIEQAIREFVEKVEMKWPGFKISLLRAHAKRATSAEEEGAMPCRHCGLISKSGECAFCRLTLKAYGKPLGEEVRRQLRFMLQRR